MNKQMTRKQGFNKQNNYNNRNNYNKNSSIYLQSKKKAREEYKAIMRQRRSAHPDHPLRDTIFAVLACFITIGLGALFVGISIGYLPLIIGGAVLVGAEIISAIIVLIVTIVNLS